MPFEKDITVAQYECDLNARMSIGSILRQSQQISTDHCDSVGAVFSVFEENNVAFLLAKISVEINCDITARDVLHMITSPTAPQKASFHRYTTAMLRGETAFAVDARWILIDRADKRILRTAPESIFLPFDEGTSKEHNIRITKAETTHVLDITATYSRTDINMHMNNTKYADCICDALPQSEIQNRRICKFVIHYHRELQFGDTMSVGTAKLDDDTYYICGEGAGAKFFEAQVVFA